MYVYIYICKIYAQDRVDAKHVEKGPKTAGVTNSDEGVLV